MRGPLVAFVACALACLVAHAAILRSVVRSRSTVGDANVPSPRLLVEVIWALIPAAALAFVLTATWNRVRDHATHPAAVVTKVAR